MSVTSRVVVCAVMCAALTTVSACPNSADAARSLDRPAPPAHGLADARVLFVDGNVEITPTEGAPFVAKVGSDLVADDRIGAATSSRVVVVLRNGHAVRIDDAGALKVRDIVLFQAPPTDRPVEEQLKELLDEGELLPLDDVRDRAAAWRQMLRAAETGGTESRADARAASAASESAGPKIEAAPAKATSMRDEGAPPPVATEPAPESPAIEESAKAKEAAKDAPDAPEADMGGLGLRGTGPGGGGAGGEIGLGSLGTKGGGTGSSYGSGAGIGGGAKKPSGVSSNDADVASAQSDERAKRRAKNAPAERQGKADSAPPPPPPPPPPPATPGVSARFGASVAEAQTVDVTPALAAMSADLGACIGRSLPATVSMKKVELLVEVRDGKAKRVRMTGALPVPLCARNVSVENAATEIAATRGNSGWLVVTVPLSR